MKLTYSKTIFFIASFFILVGISKVHAEYDCGKFFPSANEIDFTSFFIDLSGGLAFPLNFSSQKFLPMTSYGGNFSAGAGLNLGGWLLSLEYNRSMYGEGRDSGALMENFVNNVFAFRIQRLITKASISKLPHWLEIIPGFEAGYDFITTDYYTSLRAKEEGNLTSIGFGQRGAGCFFGKASLASAFNFATDWFIPYIEGDFNFFCDESIGGGFAMFFTVNIGFRSYPFGPVKKTKIVSQKNLMEEIDLTSPLAASITSNIHKNFTPDGDGQNDEAILTPLISNCREKPESWKIEILDPKGALFKSYSGKGLPPKKVKWDGKSDSGEEVFSLNVYGVRLTVIPSAADRERSGQSALVGEDSITTGIQMQVIIPNKKWKIIVNTIHFDPDKATFNQISKEQQEENQMTLDSLVQQIKSHPETLITIEGYANNVSNTERENLEELVPLSKLRAEAILQILSDKGIEKDLLSARGMGGANPLAAWEDKDSWWKNRRVEFLVEKK